MREGGSEGGKEEGKEMVRDGGTIISEPKKLTTLIIQ